MYFALGRGESLRRGWKRVADLGARRAHHAVGGEKHRVSEIGIVVSCGDTGERGWRAELDLGGGKSLDDHHPSATFGTEPKWAGFLGRGGF